MNIQGGYFYLIPGTVRVMQNYFYKLTETELRALVPAEVANKIVAKALKRKPLQWLNPLGRRVFRHYLNKAKSIWVQNVHYYGGENFNMPYAFVAEVCHVTTGSHFSQWLNKHPSFPRGRIAFTY